MKKILYKRGSFFIFLFDVFLYLKKGEKTKMDHLHPTPWGNLSESEKKRNLSKTRAVLNSAMKNPNKLIPYEFLNKAGLEHLYRFLVDSWNDNHPGRILILEKGIRYAI